jgi:hypothetical protein
MNIIPLCMADLCVAKAACSYLLRGVRVRLCETHLGTLRQKTGLSREEIAHRLPGFVWIPAEEKVGT